MVLLRRPLPTVIADTGATAVMAPTQASRAARRITRQPIFRSIAGEHISGLTGGQSLGSVADGKALCRVTPDAERAGPALRWITCPSYPKLNALARRWSPRLAVVSQPLMTLTRTCAGRTCRASSLMR